MKTGQRRGAKRGGCAMERRGQRKLQGRGCYRSVRVHQRDAISFSFYRPELPHALSRSLSPFAIASLARIIHKLLTSERLKDQALFEVDSKEVIPRLGKNLPQKNPRKNDEILSSPRDGLPLFYRASCPSLS